MPSAITDILWWANSEVDKLSGLALPEMTYILEQAEAELKKKLVNWLVSLKGADRFTPQMYRNALLQIRSVLNHLDNRFAKDTAEALSDAGQVAGKYAISHLITEVETFSQMFEGSVRPISLESTAVLAESNRILWPRFESSAARYAGEIGRDIRRQLAIGHIQGETIDQLTARLARHGGPKGLVYLRGHAGSPNAKAEYISEGLFKRYKYWGERLARTEIVNAYNTVARVTIDDLNEYDDGYFLRWDAAIDGRTCIICGELDDKVVKPGEDFPGGFLNPPAHPNCRCAVVAWRKEWHEHEHRHKDDLVAELPHARPGRGGLSDIDHAVTRKRKR